MSEQTTQHDCAAGSQPVDAHKRLEPFAGRFKARVKLWMGPGDPCESTGIMENKWILGGRFLQQVYKSDANAGGPFPEFAGQGYWGYNSVDQQYEGFWIDTASTMMQTEAGQVDDSGKVWTMRGQMTCPQTKQPMKKRTVITLKDRDHHAHESYFTMPGEAECKVMEIQYERIGR